MPRSGWAPEAERGAPGLTGSVPPCGPHHLVGVLLQRAAVESAAHLPAREPGDPEQQLHLGPPHPAHAERQPPRIADVAARVGLLHFALDRDELVHAIVGRAVPGDHRQPGLGMHGLDRRARLVARVRDDVEARMEHVEEERSARVEVLAHAAQRAQLIVGREHVLERAERDGDQRVAAGHGEVAHVGLEHPRGEPARPGLAPQAVEHRRVDVEPVDVHAGLERRKQHAPTHSTHEARSAAPKAAFSFTRRT